MKIDVRLIAVLLAFGFGAACNKRPESPVFGDKAKQGGGEIPGKTSGTGNDANGNGAGVGGKGTGADGKGTDADGSGTGDGGGTGDNNDKPTNDGKDKPTDQGKPQPDNSGNAQLTAACTPGSIEVKNQEGEAFGIYGKAIPDPQTILREIAVKDCLSMYKKPEEFRKREKITIVIRAMDGVAYATPLQFFNRLALFKKRFK